MDKRQCPSIRQRSSGPVFVRRRHIARNRRKRQQSIFYRRHARQHHGTGEHADRYVSMVFLVTAVFIYSLVKFALTFRIPAGSAVALITAMDADSGDFGKITYLLDRLSSQVNTLFSARIFRGTVITGSFQGKFTIDTNSGMLRVADALDREQTSAYNLIVEAWDNYQFGYVSGESRNAFKQIT